MRQSLNYLRIIEKDLLCNFRSAVTIIAVPFFALLVIVIFAFAFNSGVSRDNTGDYNASILWVALIFASVIGLNQTFAAEKENACLRGLLLCPIERSTIYLGKFVSSLVIIIFTELITIPVFLALFGVSCRIWDLALIVFLSSLGLSAVGTLLSAISSTSRLREVIFPIIFFPIIVPLAIASIGATSAVFEGQLLSEVFSWLKIILAFDILFLVLSFLLFGTTVEGA